MVACSKLVYILRLKECLKLEAAYAEIELPDFWPGLLTLPDLPFEFDCPEIYASCIVTAQKSGAFQLLFERAEPSTRLPGTWILRLSLLKHGKASVTSGSYLKPLFSPQRMLTFWSVKFIIIMLWHIYQGKSYEASRDSRCWVTASKTSIFSR
jgi:hypothetical protein